MEPEMLPPTVSPQQPTQQRPGIFGRVRDFFTIDDPNAGQATDPFEGLSRAQRTMLGFAALRDAAASLEGRDSAFFQEALGGFEAGRERERLRAQGQMQNQVGALQALAQIEQQIALSQAYGVAPSPALVQLREALTAQAMGGGMIGPAVIRDGEIVPQPIGGGAQLPPVPQPGARQGVPQTGVEIDPVTGETMPYAGEPEIPVVQEDPMAELDRREAELLQQMRQIGSAAALGGATANTQAQQEELQLIQRQREAMAEAETGAAEAAARARPAGTAAGIAIREADDMLLALGFDPETGEQVEESQVAGPRGRLAAGTSAGQFITAGGPTADFLNNMQSLKDTVAIQRLLEIKEAGAGLGAIPQSQLEALARALGNLNVSSSDEVLARNLRDIRRLYAGIVERSLSDSDDPTFRGLVRDIASPPRGGSAVNASGGAIGLTPEQQALIDRYSQ
jgi:hypothetical protein